jgi:hypothetical protein
MHPTPAVWPRLRPALTASRQDDNALAERAGLVGEARRPRSGGAANPVRIEGRGAMVGTSTLTDRVSATECTHHRDNPPMTLLRAPVRRSVLPDHLADPDRLPGLHPTSARRAVTSRVYRACAHAANCTTSRPATSKSRNSPIAVSFQRRTCKRIRCPAPGNVFEQKSSRDHEEQPVDKPSLQSSERKGLLLAPARSAPLARRMRK